MQFICCLFGGTGLLEILRIYSYDVIGKPKVLFLFRNSYFVIWTELIRARSASGIRNAPTGGGGKIILEWSRILRLQETKKPLESGFPVV